MPAGDVKRLRDLMDPVRLDICLLCGGSKSLGYLTCPKCRGICPDLDCKGKGTKSWDYDQCPDCYAFLQGLPDGYDWFVYLLNDSYPGMTSDLIRRDVQHRKEKGSFIVWHTPPELHLDKRQAFKFEWALKRILIEGVGGHNYLAKRFEMITGIPASTDAIEQQPPLYRD